jgi:hypothetical protein
MVVQEVIKSKYLTQSREDAKLRKRHSGTCETR